MFKKGEPNATENLGKTNRIVYATEIKGDITSEADFRLDGLLHGNFTCKGRLVIGAQGKLVGDIKCANLDIEGVFEGTAIVDALITLRTSAVVTGHLKMKNLVVEQGAKVNSTCEMHAEAQNTKTAEKGEKK
ncbi:polymer-forming cytoskeletal protein [Flavobacterium agricola]|uniref:Polymer-forming cytoskeletal protein n=1 Tax=Flavobacterium agricola TaxID=2870839 RepID=A0ABY6LX83_9FLAO|nr:polymer-forming cytoskeletal protein [Flavobacterium agricola]UYW00896.1 polymer-forming cytoskeletal protein [Flavobacterium agricola]